MSDRNNPRDHTDLAFAIGTGVTVIGATLVAAAAVNAHRNEVARKRSSQDDDDEESAGINWDKVFSTIGSLAGAVVADAANELLSEQTSRPALTSSQQQNCCGICSQALPIWGGSKELSCKHKFHTVCIRKWKETNRRCPTCGSLVLL